MDVQTMRVLPTDAASQGPFVVINADDFDPAVHQRYEVDAPQQQEPAAPRRGRPPKSSLPEA
jgi:hypothetical protein